MGVLKWAVTPLQSFGGRAKKERRARQGIQETTPVNTSDSTNRYPSMCMTSDHEIMGAINKALLAEPSRPLHGSPTVANVRNTMSCCMRETARR